MDSVTLVTIRSTRASKTDTGVDGRWYDMTDLARSSGFGICMLLFMHVLVVFLAQLAWVDNGQVTRRFRYSEVQKEGRLSMAKQQPVIK